MHALCEWLYSPLDNVRSHIITTVPFFPDASWSGFLYYFDSSTSRKKNKEPISNSTPICLHMQTKPNPIDILGNTEILARMRLGKMACMVYYNNTYHITAEDILYIAHPRLDLSGKWIIRGCARTCLHMSKGVFRSLIWKRQTTDSSNLFSFKHTFRCLTMGYAPFVYSSEALLHYASPNWLADMTLCLGVASPPLSINEVTQRHYDIQKLLLASHQKPLTNSWTNNWPPRRFRQTPSILHSSRLQVLFDTTMAAAMQTVPASEGDAVQLCSCGNKISCKDTHQVCSEMSWAKTCPNGDQEPRFLWTLRTLHYEEPLSQASTPSYPVRPQSPHVT